MVIQGRKGQAVEIVVATLVIALTIAGTAYTLIVGDDIYVGDMKTKIAYDYSSCSTEIMDIPEKNKVIFESLNHAEKDGYTVKKRC